MSDKKPPLPDNGELLGEFAVALKSGRRLDLNAPKVTPNPELEKLEKALNGEGAPFVNPMKDSDTPGDGQSTKQGFTAVLALMNGEGDPRPLTNPMKDVPDATFKFKDLRPGFKLDEPGKKK